MKMLDIKNTDLKVSNLVLGCMRIKELEPKAVEDLVRTAMEVGINFFDHADIYGGGACESYFSECIGMNPALREKMIIQSKCGIRQGYYDFSKEHIIASVNESLKRLKTEYLDVLLLHRPDTLMEPEEVAEAFDELHSSGKVRYFGVSNHNPMQVELLQKYINQKLVFNQLQFGPAHTPMVDSGMTVNMKTKQSINFEGSVLEYCRLKDMTIQTWSPFQKSNKMVPPYEEKYLFLGTFLGDMENYGELNRYIHGLAKKYDVTDTAIVAAWILRHPANMQVILGTTNKQRVIDAAAGSEISLTREEWYGMYKAAGNLIP